MKMNRITFLLMLIFALSFSAVADETQGSLVKVEPVKVCMVNDQIFEKDQIPVDVEGKTYYGCCKMCKKTLTENREFRVATDPVTGKEVDKAKAIIGADKEGKTLYFESAKTFEQYNSQAKQ